MLSKTTGMIAPALVCLAAGLAQGNEGFRIDTDIFKGSDKTPIIETQTLFTEGQVYDFLLTKPIEITIYDAARGQVTLLDPERKLKTVVTASEIQDLVFAIKEQSLEGKEPLFVFASEPKFEINMQPFTENTIPKMRLSLT